MSAESERFRATVYFLVKSPFSESILLPIALLPGIAIILQVIFATQHTLILPLTMDHIIQLRGDYITLAQAVKIAGWAGTGGQAKILVRSGDIRVNGELALQPAKKLRAGDRIENGNDEWIIRQ